MEIDMTKQELKAKLEKAKENYDHCAYMLSSGKSEDGHEADIMEYLIEEIMYLEGELNG
jgi:hypothetical protein